MMTKTMSFAVMHFTIAFAVAYLITGSIIVGGTVAMVEPAVNTVGYYFHELVWARMSEGDGDSSPPEANYSYQGATG